MKIILTQFCLKFEMKLQLFQDVKVQILLDVIFVKVLIDLGAKVYVVFQRCLVKYDLSDKTTTSSLQSHVINSQKFYIISEFSLQLWVKNSVKFLKPALYIVLVLKLSNILLFKYPQLWYESPIMDWKEKAVRFRQGQEGIEQISTKQFISKFNKNQRIYSILINSKFKRLG